MPNSYSFSTAMLINNPDALEKVVGRETLVVMGSARSMTSIISFTLYELNYFIGSELQKNNFEDQEFLRAIPPGGIFKKPLSRRINLLELIKKRNAEHERWGFKLPHAVDHVQTLPTLLRNPVIALCVRNPVGVVRSIDTREPFQKGDLTGALKSAVKWIPAMQWLLEQDTLPSVIINMDEVKRKPGVFLRDFTDLMQISGERPRIREMLLRRGYKEAEPREGVTFLGKSN